MSGEISPCFAWALSAVVIAFILPDDADARLASSYFFQASGSASLRYHTIDTSVSTAAM